MKIRFKFEKTGRLKYIGHLDLLNIWNRAVKCAKLPVEYSNGFNPHMLVSFAAPLPLGLESVSEYVDVGFDDGMPLDCLPEKVNTHFPDGLLITGVYVPGEPYKRVASVVTSGEYLFVTPYEITQAQINGFLGQKSIEITKKTKKNTALADIRPDILRIETPRGDGSFKATLSLGANNLKPSLFLEALNGFLGMEEPLYKTKITRTEIFGEIGSETLPLSEVR